MFYFNNYEAFAQCVNADFSMSNFTNWTGSTGGYANGVYTATGGIIAGTPNSITYATETGRQTIMNQPGTDPETQNQLSVLPPIGNTSCRLGNPHTANCDKTGVAQEEQLSYTYLVTSANCIFTYQYAVVLHDPGDGANHDTLTRPKFTIKVLNSSGALVDPICGHYEVYAQQGNPGFKTSSPDPLDQCNNDDDVVWKDWTPVSIDLTSYVGQSITIQFDTRDCNPNEKSGKHFGYAYISCYCGSLSLFQQCAGTSDIATAPDGFVLYQWTYINASGTSTTVTTTTNTITINPVPNGQTITCVMTSVTGCTVTLTLPLLIDIPVITPAAPTICSGQTAIITASGLAPYTYEWNTGVIGASISVSPTTTTTYTLTATSAGGCTNSSYVVVTVNNATITASGGTICKGSSQIITASGASTYTWENGVNGATQNVSPTTTTTYNVTGTNNTCTNTSQAIVTVNPLPNVTATGGSMCENSSFVIYANGANTYLWNDGTTINPKIVSPAKTTSYYVTGTDGNGCTNVASCQVCVLSTLVLNIFPGEICNGGTATISITNGSSFTWNTGANTSSITVAPTVTTTYYVTGTSASGCSVTNSLAVTVNQLPSVSVAGKTICYGTSSTLTANHGGGSGTYSSYLWMPGSLNGQTITVTPLANTIYNVTLTDSKGCTATTTVSVIVSPQMAASITKTDATCGLQNGSAQVTGNGGIPNTTGDSYNYLWNYGNYTTAKINNVSSGTYIVTLTDAIGCTTTASVIIGDTPPVIIKATSTKASCFPNGTATVIVTSGVQPCTYIWNNGQTTQTATNLNPGTYTVTVTDGNGCSAVVNVTVLENNPLSVSTITTPEHCRRMDGTAAANASGGNPALYTYLWDNGKTTKILDGLTQGSYNVTVNYGTCKISHIAFVLGKFGPRADFTYTPSILDIFENTTALFDDLSTPGGQSIVKWHWNFSDDNSTADIRLPAHTYKSAGIYTVCLKVTDSENCADSICKPIVVKDIFTVYIPNAFSPNEDLLNESFIPQGYRIDPNDFLMLIFNRWGEMIYKTNDFKSPWNGRYMNKGNLVQVGVYVYRVIVKELDGPKHEFIGRVSVIR
jgi:gliding motility-associated-like protein